MSTGGSVLGSGSGGSVTVTGTQDRGSQKCSKKQEFNGRWVEQGSDKCGSYHDACWQSRSRQSNLLSGAQDRGSHNWLKKQEFHGTWDEQGSDKWCSCVDTCMRSRQETTATFADSWWKSWNRSGRSNQADVRKYDVGNPWRVESFHSDWNSWFGRDDSPSKSKTPWEQGHTSTWQDSSGGWGIDYDSNQEEDPELRHDWKNHWAA